MKKILFVLSIIISVQSFGQWVQMPTSAGIGYKRMGGDTLVWIPSDTLLPTNQLIARSHIAFKAGVMYRWNGTAWVAVSASTPTWQQVLTAGSTLTGNNTIINGANTLAITNNSLAGVPGLKLSTTSTLAATDLQKLLEAELSGVNANAGQRTYGIYVANVHTGVTSENVGIYSAAADGATQNVGLYAQASSSSGTPTNYGVDVLSNGTGANFGMRIITESGLTNTGLSIINNSGGYSLITSGGTSGFGTSTPSALVHINGAAGFRYVDGFQGVGKVLQDDGTGTGVGKWTTPSTVATEMPINGIRAATGINTANHGNFTQTWNWPTLTSGALLINAASTTMTNSSYVFGVVTSGANGSINMETRAGEFQNTHTGTGSTNNALYLIASGGTTNNAIYVSAGNVNLQPLTASQAVFTDASKNLVSNAISGSGNVAMTTSPLFATPRLNSTSTIGHVWTATDGSGNGSFQAAAGGASWNGITNPTGDQALTFDVGESSTWTNSNTIEDLLTINDATQTTASVVSINRTSTALAAGNNIMELVSSGANATASITSTTLKILNTNTGTTNTNNGLELGVSGGVTNNAIFAHNSPAGTAQFTLSLAGNNISVLQGYNNGVAGNGFLCAQYSGGYFTVGSPTGTEVFFAQAGSVGVGFGTETVSAKVTIAAGTASENTAPEKFTAGTLMTVIEPLTREANASSLYGSNVALNRYAEGGAIKDFITTVDNGTTLETDLYTYTTKANTLIADGEKLTFNIGGTFNDLTATAQLRFYFGGTSIGNTGALTVSALGGWSANVFIIRTSSTTVRALVAVTTPGASTAVYTTQTDLTGLTLSATNIIKVTGTAAGASGGSGDISAKLGVINWFGAANN